DDDAALHFADRQLRIWPDQPGRLGQADRVHGGLERGLADHWTLDRGGLDLHILVAVAHRLRDERERDDRDERVEAQVGRFAYRAGQPIFGVNAGPEVGAGG